MTQTLKTSTLIKRFLPFYKPYRRIFFLDLFCAGLTSVCELVLPLIFRYLTNQAAQDITALSMEVIAALGAMYLALRIVDAVAQYYMNHTGHIMGAYIETDMRRNAFSHLQKLSDSYYSETKVGQIMSRITNDLFDVTEFSHHCPEEFFIAGLKIVISFFVLLTINVPLTLAIFILIPVMLLASSRFRTRMANAFQKQREHVGDINAGIEDSLLGIKVVKSFANEDIEREKFEVSNRSFLDIKKDTYRAMAGYNSINRLFDGLMYLVIMVFGGYLTMRGSITPGDLVAYVLYATTMLGTVSRIVLFAEAFQKGISGIRRYFELIDTDIEIFDEDNAVAIGDVKGDITMEDVSFSYPNTQRPVLDHFHLKIRAGEKLALVGPSGGGKTTLANLIPRFYDLDAGRILIDGKDIKGITLQSLRDHIGMVQQDVYLFSGSIRENIVYGKPGADEASILRAARQAGAYDFISELPDGLDSYVGERGIKLSGGQKQRISIARVFLKNPPILILDEATSALDNESEQLIQASLALLSEGRTTITIAHRLSTIQDADTIVVLTKDGIQEKGSHQELIDQRGVYYDLLHKKRSADFDVIEEEPAFA